MQQSVEILQVFPPFLECNPDLFEFGIEGFGSIGKVRGCILVEVNYSQKVCMFNPVIFKSEDIGPRYGAAKGYDKGDMI